jgi:hypothetical protein
MRLPLMLQVVVVLLMVIMRQAQSGLDGDADLAMALPPAYRAPGPVRWTCCLLELEVQEREEAFAMFCAESGQAGQCRIFAFTVPDLRRSRATDR